MILTTFYYSIDFSDFSFSSSSSAPFCSPFFFILLAGVNAGAIFTSPLLYAPLKQVLSSFQFYVSMLCCDKKVSSLKFPPFCILFLDFNSHSNCAVCTYRKQSAAPPSKVKQFFPPSNVESISSPSWHRWQPPQWSRSQPPAAFNSRKPMEITAKSARR